MGTRRLRTAPSLILVLLLLAPGFALADSDGNDTTTGAFDPCDLDKDGRVDDAERWRCEESAPQPNDRCDYDADSSVSPTEAGRCATTYPACDLDRDGRLDAAERKACFAETTTQLDRCDFDRSGVVDDREKAWCPEAPLQKNDRCDANGDGLVGPLEAERCVQAYPRCDANGDGRLQAVERERCFAEVTTQGDRCDFDRSGFVDEREKAWCAEATLQPNDRCDANGDGVVGPLEAERCAQAFPRCDASGDGRLQAAERQRCFAEATHEYDRCDTDGDGAVSREESARCATVYPACDADGSGLLDEAERKRCFGQPSTEPARHPCDFDGNGVIDEPERMRCTEAFRDRCDFDGNGVVDEFERRKCASEAEIARPAVDDDCRRAIEHLRAERESFYRSLQELRDRFARDLEEEHARFAETEPSEEDWMAFRERLERKRLAFEEDLRARMDAFERDHARIPACEGQGVPTTRPHAGDCAPDEDAYLRFRGYVEEQDRRFRDEMERRAASFRAMQEAEWEKFISAMPTEDEMRAFRHRQDADRARFEVEMQEHAARHRAHLESLWNEFRDKHHRACTVEPVAERRFEEVQKDVRAERFACELDIQARLDAFYARHGRDASAWDQAQVDAFVDLQLEIRRHRHMCEARLHMAWKEEVRTHFETRAKYERFGDFAFEPAGDGRGRVAGRFVAFEYEVGSLVLRDYTVQGLRLFERFYAPHDVAEPTVDGRLLTTTGYDRACEDRDEPRERCRFLLGVHDAPAGNLRVECRGPNTCLLTLPEGAERASRSSEGGAARYRVSYGDDTASAILVFGGDHAWDGGTAEFRGGMHIFVPAESFVHDDFANKHREEIRAAVEAGRILAEVDVVKTEGGTEHDKLDYTEVVDEVETKVEVRVEAKGDGVLIEFDAESEGGGILVFNVDASFFGGDIGGLDASGFHVVYSEVDDDGVATEVEIAPAASLADVLAGGKLAYWLVVDANGLQAIVSNEHFSTKRFEIQSAVAPAPGARPPATEDGDDGRGTPFPAALAVLAVVGVAALVARRRR